MIEVTQEGEMCVPSSSRKEQLLQMKHIKHFEIEFTS